MEEPSIVAGWWSTWLNVSLKLLHGYDPCEAMLQDQTPAVASRLRKRGADGEMLDRTHSTAASSSRTIILNGANADLVPTSSTVSSQSEAPSMAAPFVAWFKKLQELVMNDEHSGGEVLPPKFTKAAEFLLVTLDSGVISSDGAALYQPTVWPASFVICSVSISHVL